MNQEKDYDGVEHQTTRAERISVSFEVKVSVVVVIGKVKPNPFGQQQNGRNRWLFPGGDDKDKDKDPFSLDR